MCQFYIKYIYFLIKISGRAVTITEHNTAPALDKGGQEMSKRGGEAVRGDLEFW